MVLIIQSGPPQRTRLVNQFMTTTKLMTVILQFLFLSVCNIDFLVCRSYFQLIWSQFDDLLPDLRAAYTSVGEVMRWPVRQFVSFFQPLFRRWLFFNYLVQPFLPFLAFGQLTPFGIPRKICCNCTKLYWFLILILVEFQNIR